MKKVFEKSIYSILRMLRKLIIETSVTARMRDAERRAIQMFQAKYKNKSSKKLWIFSIFLLTFSITC